MDALGVALCTALDLEFVRVGVCTTGQDRAASAGRTAAEFIDGAVERPVRIACGWGRTMREIGAHARSRATCGVVVCDIVGQAAWWSPGDVPFHLSEALARAYSADVRRMPSPAFFTSADEARRACARPDVVQALADAATADIVLVSPGTADPDTSSLIIGGGMTREQVLAARSDGAIGDIVGQFFDASGAPVSNELDERMVRLSLDQLRAGRVVAISVGREKVTTIRAAARGRLIKALITDEQTARELLESA